jgi:hypothetical protein
MIEAILRFLTYRRPIEAERFASLFGRMVDQLLAEPLAGPASEFNGNA